MANANHSREKYIQIAEKVRGQKRTQEQKDKISNALMGHKHSAETLAKMRKPRSEQAKLNMSNAMKGRTPWNKGKTGIYSQETISKIRDANLGKKTPLEIRKKLSKSLVRFFQDKDPNYIPPTYEQGEWRRNHIEIRKERMKKNGGSHSKRQWEYLKAAYNYKCNICNKKEPIIKLTKDHIISVKSGGSDDISNIQPLCQSCNSKKH